MTPETLKAVIEQEQTVEFWGNEYTFTPRLLDVELGDGQQMIWFQPLQARPRYYVLRVDSTWNIDDDDGQDHDFRDHLNEIWEALEDCFGVARCGECEELYGGCELAECKDEADLAEWPAVDSEGGCFWGAYELPAPVLQ